MRLIDQYPLYELGVGLQQVKDLSTKPDVTAFDQMIPLFAAGTALANLLQGNPVEVSYSRSSAQKIKAEVDSILSRFRDKETRKFLSEPKPVDNWEFSNLKNLIEVFEHQFSAELKKTATYVVPRRGIFDTERLVGNADEHLSQMIRSGAPEFVLAEFRAAGRCLAFGLFSASGFHALRAAERALKQYYIAFLGEPTKDEMTMGLRASHLQGRIDCKDVALPKPTDTTMRTIQDVIKFDRNPLTHRELELSEDDAFLLFNRAQGMISVMSKEILDRAEELSPQLPLMGGAATSPFADIIRKTAISVPSQKHNSKKNS